VACGICLPHCPTYLQSLNENESPRGRIALLRACAEGILPVSATLIAHIDHCLGCQACEAACPSGVPYGALLEDGRSLLLSDHPRGLQTRLYRALIQVTRAPRLIAYSYQLARLAATLKLLPFLGRRLGTALKDLPPRPLMRWRRPPLAKPGPADVSLFLGCTAGLDGEALDATIRILQALGQSVQIPPGQGCCGALAHHAGFTDIAAHLRRRNLGAFGHSTAPIIAIASGCTAALEKYDPTNEGTLPPVFDIHRFLVEKTAFERLTLAPLHQTLAVHEPCSLRNALKGGSYVYRLLERIPGARIVPSPNNGVCCGAAGDYFLREPRNAQRLGDAKAAALAQLRPDIVVSANIGCALHLSAALKRHRLSIPVVHPLVVLAQQLLPTPQPMLKCDHEDLSPH